MYRFTYDGPKVVSLRASMRGTPTTLRVYKWEDKTGYLFQDAPKWEAAWIAEQRTPIGHGSGWLLERVTPLRIDAPPPTVDDLWTEEVIVRGNVIAGNMLTIVGNEKEIGDYAARTGITLPAFPPPLVPVPVREPLLPQAEAPASTPCVCGDATASTAAVASAA
jgi:hypothetical protein